MTLVVVSVVVAAVTSYLSFIIRMDNVSKTEGHVMLFTIYVCAARSIRLDKNGVSCAYI